MKSKNLVSLFVVAIYLVLAVTGLMIYLGQGNYFSAKHLHAWFGILFFAASVFHILNNWASIKAYSVNRKVGGIRRELLLPVLITLVFTVGIAADLPVFKDLANAGKRAFGPDKKKERGLSQLSADSIARKLMTDYTLAISKSDTTQLAHLLSKKASISNEAGNVMSSTTLLKSLKPGNPIESMRIQVEQTTVLDDHVIVATGIATPLLPDATQIRFTQVLNETDGHWQIAALQLAPLTTLKSTVVVR